MRRFLAVISIFLLVFLFVVISCYSQEVVTSYDKNSLPILNEELRDTRYNISTIQRYYSSGILDVTHGGTGVSSVTSYAPIFGGTTSTGSFQSGTTGTSGQVLMSNGAGALPTFQTINTGSWKFLSKTTVSAASVSSDIAINPANFYKVVVNLSQNTSNGYLSIRINSLSTNIYEYSLDGLDSNNGAITANSASADEIIISPTLLVTVHYGHYLEFMIFPTNTTGDDVVQIAGKSCGRTSGGYSYFADFSGLAVLSSGTVSSFEILTSAGTYTGDIIVYELSIS